MERRTFVYFGGPIANDGMPSSYFTYLVLGVEVAPNLFGAMIVCIAGVPMLNGSADRCHEWVASTQEHGGIGAALKLAERRLDGLHPGLKKISEPSPPS